jgi:hypothetical protein
MYVPDVQAGQAEQQQGMVRFDSDETALLPRHE